MRKLGLGLIIAVIVLVLGGCNGEKLKETVLTPWDKWAKTPVGSVGDDIGTPDDLTAEPPRASDQTVPVTIYYVKDGLLSKKVTSIPKVEGIARRTLQEMLEKPAPSGFKSAFPDGVKLNDINLKPDGTCVLDLGSEVLKLKGIPKKTAISALTRTLEQYPTIKQVVILVNGEEIPEWVGPWQVGEK